MILAGIEILGFNGLQSFDDVNGQWDNIGVQVNYPQGQNPVDNPITVGDVMIEPGGAVWNVLAVTDEGSGEFSLSIALNDRPTTDTDTPGFGLVTRGGIATPRNGMLAAYWDSSVVAASVARIASIYSVQNAETDLPVSVWQNTVDAGELA